MPPAGSSAVRTWWSSRASSGRAGCPTARAGSRSWPQAGRSRSPTTRPGTLELAELWRSDRPAPPAVLDGLVEVLKRWSKSWDRPVAVVAMPSRRFPTLVDSVAEHIATVGRLPLVDALAVSGPPPSADSSSAVRAKDLLYRTSCAGWRGVRRSGAAGRRHHPHPLDRHRGRIAAGRGGRDVGAAAGRSTSSRVESQPTLTIQHRRAIQRTASPADAGLRRHRCISS